MQQSWRCQARLRPSTQLRRRSACHLVVASLPLPAASQVQARELLEAVARQVQPIMHRRQLTCPLLLEFFPTNARLYVSS